MSDVENQQVQSVSLDGEWQLRSVAADGATDGATDAISCSAPVPGSVHDALARDGRIDDPLLGARESELTWISRTDWVYSTAFDAPANPNGPIDLVFDGIDTFATVLLNGVELGRTRNQHRSYRFRIDGALRDGSNRLEVHLRAPLTVAEDEERMLGPRPHLFDLPFNTVRKMASNFGWDWGPSLVTAGIWRSVRLESWSAVRIAALRVDTRLGDDVIQRAGHHGPARVHIDVDLVWDERAEEAVEISIGVAGAGTSQAVTAGTASVRFDLDVDEVEPWWPRGEGAQRLYELAVTATDRSGRTVSSTRRRIGFREVAVESTADESGVGFGLAVNGRPVYVRGVNWIPADVLSPERPADEYRRLLESAAGAGMNLVRVWGGGVYESERFYDVCDELGLLVWQDFLFACSAYSEDERLANEVELEAREAVLRLDSHASLAIWCGNNENLWGHDDWNWAPQLDGADWGERYYREVLPALVAELSPSTPYVPGSPFSVIDQDQNAPHDSLHHAWTVWNELDYEGYSGDAPRFVSEFGFQSPPSWSALQLAMAGEPVTPESPSWAAHQKAVDGHDKLTRSVRAHFGDLDSVEQWHWAAQLNQAHALDYAVRWYRSLAPVNRGSVVWQLNDCWPGFSWSLVDHLGYRKPAWYALRRANASLLTAVVDAPEGPRAALVNHTPEHQRVPLRVRRTDFDGLILAEQHRVVDVAPGTATSFAIDGLVASPGDAARELLMLDAPDHAGPAIERLVHTFAAVQHLDLPPLDAEFTVSRQQGVQVLRVEARSLVRDLWIQTDRLGASPTSEQGFVTLLPGEHLELELHGGTLEPEAWSFPIVSSANSLGSRLRVAAKEQAL